MFLILKNLWLWHFLLTQPRNPTLILKFISRWRCRICHIFWYFVLCLIFQQCHNDLAIFNVFNDYLSIFHIDFSNVASFKIDLLIVYLHAGPSCIKMAARRTVFGVLNNKNLNLYVCNTWFKCSSRYFHHCNNSSNAVNVNFIKTILSTDSRRKFLVCHVLHHLWQLYSSEMFLSII